MDPRGTVLARARGCANCRSRADLWHDRGRSLIKLRDYQIRNVDETRVGIRAGFRRILNVASCGAGKTLIFSEISASAAKKGKRILVGAPRRELVNQTVEKINWAGLECGVIMGGDRRADSWLPIQVASMQTLARRLDRLPPADVVVLDEAHLWMCPIGDKIVEAYPNAVILGYTATPFLNSKRGFGDVFQKIIVAATTRDLINAGHLVDYEIFAYTSPDLHKVKMKAGDYDTEELELASNTDIIVGSIVREYAKHGLGRRAIVFAVSVKHSQTIIAEFCANGILAKHVDADTPHRERDKILGDFKAGRISVLSSVGLFSVGTDIPTADMGILARATKSLALYIQQVGRVLRTSPGKGTALLHDHAGNTLRHGLVDQEREFSLEPTPQRVRDLSTCPACAQIFGKINSDGTCPKCGEKIAEPRELQPNGERKQKEVVEGERIGIDQIKRLREQRGALGLRDDLTDQQLRLAAKATREEKIGEFLRLEHVQKSKQLKRGFIGRQFRDLFGHWPKFTPDELAGKFPARRPFLNLPRKAAP